MLLILILNFYQYAHSEITACGEEQTLAQLQ